VRRARWCGNCGEALAIPSVAVATPVRAAGRPSAGWLVALVAVLGLGSLAVTAVASLDGRISERGTLALDLPARAEVAAPEPIGGTSPPIDVAASASDVVASAPTGAAPAAGPDGSDGGAAAPSRCLDGVACRVWRVELLSGTDPGAIVTGGGAIVVPSVRGMRAYDARTGAHRWSVAVRVPGNRVVAPRAAIADGLVLIASSGERLHAYRLTDGERVWSATIDDLEQVVDARVLDGQLLVLGRRTEQRASRAVLLALDPADGWLRWRADVGGGVLTDAGPVSRDQGPGVRGHDPVDGAVRWSALEDRAVGDLRSAGPLVLATVADERLLLDGATGTQVARLPRRAMMGPLPTERATVVPGDDRALFVDGDGIAWQVPVPGGCCTGHLVGADEVTLRRSDGGLIVLDRADGSLLADHGPLEADGADLPGWLLGGLEFSAVADDLAVAPRLRVRDVRTGRLLDELPAVSPVAVLGRDVVVASYDWMLRLTPRPSRFGPTGSLRTQ
jgi:hypothetical protein